MKNMKAKMYFKQIEKRLEVKLKLKKKKKNNE